MLLLIFFLTADTISVSGDFYGKWAIKLPSLGVLDLGYINPSLSNGLNGCMLNPAALSDIEANNFATAFEIGSATNINWVQTLELGDEIGIVKVPCHLSFTQPVSLNMVSGAINFKGWILGLGFAEEFGTNLQVEGNASYNCTFSDTMPDTITHTDIPELPESDSIPVDWIFTTPIELAFAGGAGMGLSENDLFLGIARKGKWFKTGIGITYKPIRGSLWTNLSAEANAPCTLSCNVSAGEWQVKAIGNTTIDERLFNSNGIITLTGNEFNFLAGMRIDLSFFKLGAVITLAPRTILTLNGNLISTYISGLPPLDSIYSQGVQVDTGAKIVTGTMGVKFSPFPTAADTNRLNEQYELEERVGVNIGSALRIWKFTLGSSIGANTLGEFCVGIGGESRIFFPLRWGFETRNRVCQVNGEKFILPPYAVIGIGSSVVIKKVELAIGLRTNSFTSLGSLIGSLEEANLPSIFELFSPVIGVNVKFE
ncbi:MAG: hypothetical protein HY769_10635 [Candidatus Stahlbacteria bacterium]|nr:hypothetical protein [Candidatus Stahlbacteria bacterium]